MPKKQSSAALRAHWTRMKKLEKDGLAASVESSVGYLRQVFLYAKSPGAVMAKKLGEVTGLGACAFRPDLFGHVEKSSSDAA